MVAGLVLAAGAGTRFGGRKQLAELDGRPLLEHALAAMASAPVSPVAVVLGSDSDEISRLVAMHGAEPIVCPEWDEGQSASLRTGIDALERAGAEAVVITLGHPPPIAAPAIAAGLAARVPGADGPGGGPRG